MNKKQFQKITGFTKEQAENLLKNPYFFAEHEAFKATKDSKPLNLSSIFPLQTEFYLTL